MAGTRQWNEGPESDPGEAGPGITRAIPLVSSAKLSVCPVVTQCLGGREHRVLHTGAALHFRAVCPWCCPWSVLPAVSSRQSTAVLYMGSVRGSRCPSAGPAPSRPPLLPRPLRRGQTHLQFSLQTLQLLPLLLLLHLRLFQRTSEARQLLVLQSLYMCGLRCPQRLDLPHELLVGNLQGPQLQRVEGWCGPCTAELLTPWPALPCPNTQDT